jgi:quercetin dioxygenase-like cupin family protein
MTPTIMSPNATIIHWADLVEYPQTGVKSKVLLEAGSCRYTLMSLAEGTHIAEHANSRNATVNVIEGQGVLILKGKELVLEAGVFIFIPATSSHAVKSETNLTFLLTLSDQSTNQ